MNFISLVHGESLLVNIWNNRRNKSNVTDWIWATISNKQEESDGWWCQVDNKQFTIVVVTVNQIKKLLFPENMRN